MLLLPPILAALGQASVSLTLTPPVQCAPVGALVDVAVVLSTDAPTAVAAVDLIVKWNPAQLQLVQTIPGSGPWFVAGYFNDPDGINTSTSDGDALYTLLGNPVTPPTLPPNQTAATFRFQVIADSQVNLLPTLGAFGKTQVLGTTPGSNLTGAIVGPASIGAVGGTALETVRLGSPPNPNAFRPGFTHAPVLGQTWDPYIDHASFAPGALLDAFGVTLAPINVPLPPFGTLLCLPPVAGPLFKVPAGQKFAVPIPIACELVGVALYTQAFSLDGLGNIELTNALDIVLGTQ
ncbi:MAG: hypothetical protein EPO68_12750 [Planctomycetota bacterium]|nr:MAG: hypothetical protein EPO68_12750 [Planctomycetota bacterium]